MYEMQKGRVRMYNKKGCGVKTCTYEMQKGRVRMYT